MKYLHATFKFIKSHVVLLALLGIVLVGGFLRLYAIESKMRFIWDEGRDMLAIHQIVHDKNLTLFGPYNEIDGKKDFFGVFHYYLMAPALWLAQYDPLGPAVFTAVLGTASIILLFLFVKTAHSNSVALATALLYATNPLVIHYVQWPWNPNTTPFFALLFFLSLHRLKRTEQLRWSAIAGLLLGLLFQLHYFTIALGLAWLITVITRQFRQSRLNLFHHGLLFFGFFMLPNLSFILFDLTHEHFYWNIVTATIGGGSSQQYLNPTISGIILEPFRYTQLVLKELLVIPDLLALLITGVFGIIWAYLLKRFTGTPLTWFAASWTGILLLSILFPKTIDQHHSSYLWFGFMLLISLGIFKITRAFPRLVYWTIIACIAGYFVWQVQLFRYPSWAENMPAIRAAGELVTNDLLVNSGYRDTFAIASLTDADTRATRYKYFVVAGGFEPMGYDQYPNASVLYIFTPHDEVISKQNPVWELATFIDTPWVLLGEADHVRVYKASKQKLLAE